MRTRKAIRLELLTSIRSKQRIRVYAPDSAAIAYCIEFAEAYTSRLKESLEILGDRGDLEKKRADIAEEQVKELRKSLEASRTCTHNRNEEIVHLHKVVGRLQSYGQKAAKQWQEFGERTLDDVKYLRSEVARLEKERDGWKMAFEELTPEDIRGMALDANALLEHKLKAAEARIRELQEGK